MLNFEKKNYPTKGGMGFVMGSIIAMPLAVVTVTIGQGPKETTLIFYCVLFFFFVLFYVSLYVFFPFLHNVSRETPPSELPRTFFLKFF